MASMMQAERFTGATYFGAIHKEMIVEKAQQHGPEYDPYEPHRSDVPWYYP